MNQDEPRLHDTGRGLTIRYKGRYLYSSRDPMAGPRRRVGALRLEPGSLILVPSLGLGYGLHELLEALPERCHVLCVETEQSLMALASSSGAALPRSGALSIVRLDAPAQAAAVLQSLGVWRFRRLVAVPLCGASQLDAATYRRIQDVLEEEIRLFWQNKITLMGMSGLWLRNLFTNLEMLADAPSIEDERTDRAIVVTGAGPSLEESLEGIRRIRDRVRLLAADTSLPTLAAAGLRPDWVCVLEAQVHNLADFVPAFDPSLRLLCDLTASPTVLRRFASRVFFSSRFHPLELFDRLEGSGLLPTPLPPLGTVGVTAVELALRLTRAPVFVAGLDFCYRPGKTHSRGAPFHLSPLMSSRRLYPQGMNAFEALLRRPRLRLRGRGGAEVTSDLVLHSYARQLERLIGDSGRVYDLGGEGLPCGALPVDGEAAIDHLLGPLGSPGGHRDTGPPPEGPCRQAIAEFCRAEAALLRRTERAVLRLLDSPVTGDAGSVSAGAVPPWLQETGYLLLPLPETDPARIMAPATLRSVVAEARHLARLLGRTGSRLAAEA